ncbi:YdeI family protein [Bacteroidota bacterium]
MEISKIIYFDNRKDWRLWLRKNHKKEREIWLIYYNKASGKPRIPYNDAVEEALCYGWIDSTLKKIDKDRFTQRFTPRNHKSQLSVMNKERIRRLIKSKKMTKAGLKAVEHLLGNMDDGEPDLSPDIKKALKADKEVWNNYISFPASYKRIRIGWIESARIRPDEFEKRLKYFVKMTAKNKRYGMVQ